MMKSVFRSWFVLIAMSTCCCSSMHLNHPRLQGNETDKLALLAIKAQIQRDPNRVITSWNKSLHFCMWQGVTCSQRHRQRVTKLELGSLQLVGSISPHIGNLSFLGVLSLENNSFTHQIPPQIGRLHRLQVLLLHNNSLMGTIPANLSNCFRLTNLNLGKNNLVGEIPPQLGSLPMLQKLVLQLNNITGEIPPSLGNLSSLEVFSVSRNNLQGSIPSSLCQLTKLLKLNCGGNELSGIIPPCIYNLSRIVVFDLGLNQFLQGSLPSSLGDAFPNLQLFSIATNQFTGTIPLSISNATNLVKFQCLANKLTGRVPNLRNLHNLVTFLIYGNFLGSTKHGDLNFVSELINATQLTKLDFAVNNFGGTLPASISNLSTNLQWLAIEGNHLHGSIPAGIGNLVNLQALFIGYNSFTGSIPTDIGRLSRLGILFNNNNQLSGRIPSSFGNLTLLTRLRLQVNNLEGSIPSSLGKYRWLLELGLSGNNLNGTIPPEIFGLPSLSINLGLSRNQFTGALPIEVGKLKNLGTLDVSYNMLSGQLPSSIGSCQSLEFLYLQKNLFVGPIPSSMKELRGIQELDLSRNNFSGGIPRFFEGLGNLKNLNLSYNQFSGALPIGGIFNNASATLVIGNTRLCGRIADFGLPICKTKGGGGLPGRIKLMISLASGFSILGVVVVLFVFVVHKRKEIGLSSSKNSILRVPYAAILKATDGFSSANLIGIGAFGSVYKGILAENGIVVAVKVFNMLHRGAFKSFISECEVLRNIRHRNLVEVLTACSSVDFSGNDFKALVYEFMDNGSLEDWLHPFTGNGEVTEAPKYLSLSQRLNIAIDIANALDYLHNHCERQIVHCDLKPSNVLLDSDMIGHVSDFGISKFLSDSTSVSENQSSSIGVRGSVGYAAPEYGMGNEVSTHGDVYSFGILLLEMFTGRRPTDHMFSNNFNLHNYVKTTLPECVSETLESLVLQEDTTNVTESHMHIRAQKREECLTLILGIGIACSVESPTSRMDMSDVCSELQSIKRNVMG